MLTQTAGLPEKSGAWDAAVRSRGGDPAALTDAERDLREAMQWFARRDAAAAILDRAASYKAERDSSRKATNGRTECASPARDFALRVWSALADGVPVPADAVSAFEEILKLALTDPRAYAYAVGLESKRGSPKRTAAATTAQHIASMVADCGLSTKRARKLRGPERDKWQAGKRRSGLPPEGAFEYVACELSNMYPEETYSAGKVRGAWERARKRRG